MTKADIVAKISEKLGLEKGDVQTTIETFMEEVKTSLESGDNVYLRGFGSFIIKTRAEKTGRNISKNTTIKIPAHNIPAFKPAKVFVEGVKSEFLCILRVASTFVGLYSDGLMKLAVKTAEYGFGWGLMGKMCTFDRPIDSTPSKSTAPYHSNISFPSL